MAKVKFQAIRGMNDILPQDAGRWRYLEDVCLSVAESYGYLPLRTPMLEEQALFVRSVGENSDVVTKEMYAFEDRNGVDLVLRPEGTAPTVRAGIEHGLLYNQIQRLCYVGPMFRREKPQKGRYRQFHTFGVEVFGLDNPGIDVEIILLGQRIFEKLGVADKITCQVNSIGDQQAQDAFAQALVDYFKPYHDQLSDAVKERLEKNPLRICDSKDPFVQDLLKNGPSIVDYLDAHARANFKETCDLLDAMQVPFSVNTQLVRGLDYYNHLVFEWVSNDLGAQTAVGGGGRYNKLVDQLGGHDTPAAGFGLGLERLMMLMPAPPVVTKPTVYVMVLTKEAKLLAQRSANSIRETGDTIVIVDHTQASKKAQFKKADQANAQWLLIVGDDPTQPQAMLLKKVGGEQLIVTESTLLDALQSA